LRTSDGNERRFIYCEPNGRNVCVDDGESVISMGKDPSLSSERRTLIPSLPPPPPPLITSVKAQSLSEHKGTRSQMSVVLRHCLSHAGCEDCREQVMGPTLHRPLAIEL